MSSSLFIPPKQALFNILILFFSFAQGRVSSIPFPLYSVQMVENNFGNESHLMLHGKEAKEQL